MLALVLGLVVLLGRGSGAEDVANPAPHDTPTPTESVPPSPTKPAPPTPTADATTEAVPEPTETERTPAEPEFTPGKPDTGYTGTGMNQTRLYNVMWQNGSASCTPTALPEPPLPDDELVAHLQDVIACITEVHKPALAAEGLTLNAPTVVGYTDTVTTPCGTLTDGNPAYYCSGDQTIYVRYDSDENPDGYARSNMGYWILMSHEFGHHLQYVAGIFAEYDVARNGAGADVQEELSRRLEAQATCFSGVYLGASRVSLHYDDNLNATRNFYRFNGGRGYPSGANQVAWFEAGYLMEWNAFARCNTWSAADDQVS